MAAITICEISHQSVRVQLTGLDTGYGYADRTCKWYIGSTLKVTESLGKNISAGVEKSLSGLSANTTYTVKAVISGTNMSSSVTLTKDFSTAPGSTAPATIYTVGTTKNSISVKLNSIKPSNYTGESNATRYVHWYLNGTEKTTIGITNSTTSGAAYTFTGLSAGTSYTIGYSFNAEIWYSGSSIFTTSISTTAVAPFDWTISNGNATAGQTQAAYSAVTNKTAVSNFSYLVWNDMVDKVKEIFDAKGWNWSNSYATYANTRMTSSNKTLTATKFNSLRFNIGSHYSTGISTVSSGDIVYGSYFNTLVNCMNALI